MTNENNKEKPIIYTSFAKLPNNHLAEEGHDGEQTFFLLYNPDTGRTVKVPQIELSTHIIKPIAYDRTVLLPSRVEEYTNDTTLTKELLTYLNYWHDPPDKLSRYLDVAYVFLTYIQDLMPQVCYRRYLGMWGSGKSVWLKTLGYVCYKGMILSGSDTDKSMVRKMNLWRGTAIIDEADFSKSDEYSFIVKILNTGYDRLTGYYQRSADEDAQGVLSYYVYGCKLLATRKPFADIALESRCSTTISKIASRDVPLFQMDTFLQQAQTLRNRLTLWRFRNYYRIAEEAKKLEDPKLSKDIYASTEKIAPRVRQVLTPLWLVSGPELRNLINDIAEVFDHQLKVEDEEYQLQCQVKEAALRVIERNNLKPKAIPIARMLKSLTDEEDPSTTNQGERGERGERDIQRGVPPSEYWYSVPLSWLSRELLVLSSSSTSSATDINPASTDIDMSSITSMSKKLKSILETRLGFYVSVGSQRRRVVRIPYTFLHGEDLTTLLIFISSEEGKKWGGS